MASGLIRRLLRLLSIAAAALGWLVLLGLVAWAAGALYVDLPAARMRAPAALGYVAATVAALVLVRGGWRKAAACAAGFGLVLVWWLTLSPSNERPWQPDVARTAWAEIDGNRVTIHNLRNADYRTEADYTPRWETRTVDLAQLRGVDLFVTQWGSPWIAHPIVSFQFGDADHVAISVEARKEIGEGYSAIWGFFRQYELTYVVADERDVIRLRTNFRSGEDVYLYRTRVAPDAAGAIFLHYLRTINALHRRPAFYNALTSNCTTNIRIHTMSAAPGVALPWDWRLVLNGKGDELAYRHGRFVGDLPFEELKRRAHVNGAAQAAGDAADFSRRIREGRPGF